MNVYLSINISQNVYIKYYTDNWTQIDSMTEKAGGGWKVKPETPLDSIDSITTLENIV